MIQDSDYVQFEDEHGTRVIPPVSLRSLADRGVLPDEFPPPETLTVLVFDGIPFAVHKDGETRNPEMDYETWGRVSYSKLPDDADMSHVARGAAYRKQDVMTTPTREVLQ